MVPAGRTGCPCAAGSYLFGSRRVMSNPADEPSRVVAEDLPEETPPAYLSPHSGAGSCLTWRLLIRPN